MKVKFHFQENNRSLRWGSYPRLTDYESNAKLNEMRYYWESCWNVTIDSVKLDPSSCCNDTSSLDIIAWLVVVW